MISSSNIVSTPFNAMTVMAQHLRTLKTQDREGFCWKILPLTQSQNILIDSVNVAKEFLTNPQGDFVWYKNINIPDISMRAQKQPANEPLYAKVLCVQWQVNSTTTAKQLTSVSLDGDISKQFKIGEVRFSCLKFKSASCHQKGAKFFLVIALGGKEVLNCENLEKTTDVECLLVFSPLVVESRKKSCPIEMTLAKIYEPVMPRKLEQQFVKVTNSPPYLLQIGDDVEGLYNFFTTPTVRFKFLQPFFLQLRFPQAIKLFYNQATYKENLKYMITALQSQKNEDTPQLVVQLQDQLITQTEMAVEVKGNLKKNNKTTVKAVKVTEESLQNQQGTSQHKIDVITSFLQKLDSQAVHYELASVSNYTNNKKGQRFKEFQFTESLSNYYKEVFARLADLMYEHRVGKFLRQDEEQEKAYFNSTQNKLTLSPGSKLKRKLRDSLSPSAENVLSEDNLQQQGQSNFHETIVLVSKRAQKNNNKNLIKIKTQIKNNGQCFNKQIELMLTEPSHASTVVTLQEQKPTQLSKFGFTVKEESSQLPIKEEANFDSKQVQAEQNAQLTSSTGTQSEYQPLLQPATVQFYNQEQLYIQPQPQVMQQHIQYNANFPAVYVQPQPFMMYTSAKYQHPLNQFSKNYILSRPNNYQSQQFQFQDNNFFAKYN